MICNPKACLATDTAAQAARIMKHEKTAALPVVDDRRRNRLVGLVSNHEFTQIVAEGRDPNTIRVEQIMSRNPVTCRAGDAEQDVLEAMTRRRLVSVPVVDDAGRLIGICSRDTLARTGTRSGSFNFGTASIALLGGFCLGIGAGLMFVFDPARGGLRRAVIRDQAVHLKKQSENALSRLVRQVESRLKQQNMPGPPNANEPPEEAWDLAQLRWSSSARVLASAAGGSLLLLALAKGKR